MRLKQRIKRLEDAAAGRPNRQRFVIQYVDKDRNPTHEEVIWVWGPGDLNGTGRDRSPTVEDLRR